MGIYDDQFERMRQEHQLQQRLQAEYAKMRAMQLRAAIAIIINSSRIRIRGGTIAFSDFGWN